jgi:hypothetical protein
MSDRIKGVVVAFEHDLKDEDAAELIKAISMIRGIANVSPSVVNHDDYMNRAQIKWELRSQLMQILVHV